MTRVITSAASHIDGVQDPGGGPARTLVEPATGAPLGEVALAAPADVDRAVAAARAALEGAWGRTPATERSRLLHELAGAVERDADELAELEARNVGKAIREVRAEVQAAARTLRFFASIAGDARGGAERVERLASSTTRPAGRSACARRSCPGTTRC